MSRRWLTCPQCDERVELERGPRPVDRSRGVVEPEVIASRCQLCVAWIRIEGWSDWTATHYSMTPFRDDADALQSFPKGIWLAVTRVQPPN